MSPAPLYLLLCRFSGTAPASTRSMFCTGGMSWADVTRVFQRVNKNQARWLGPDQEHLLYSVVSA